MKTIHEIERAVSDLPPEELSRFRAWFFEFDAQIWDEQVESDIVSGRLKALANEARADLRSGRASPL